MLRNVVLAAILVLRSSSSADACEADGQARADESAAIDACRLSEEFFREDRDAVLAVFVSGSLLRAYVSDGLLEALYHDGDTLISWMGVMEDQLPGSARAAAKIEVCSDGEGEPTWRGSRVRFRRNEDGDLERFDNGRAPDCTAGGPG